MQDQNINILQQHIVHPEKINTLLPKVSNPFFIVTPPFARISAGVTVLHLLCHYLNRLGETAYIVHYPPESTPLRSLPSYATLQEQKDFPSGMLTPLITQELLDFYHERRLTPIVIYPEVFDNPFKAHFFGRYILNYPGKLNVKYQEREDFAFAYTKTLADHCTIEYSNHLPVSDVLFVPTSDLEFWSKNDSLEQRQGTCFYAGKLKEIHGISPENVPDGSVEILRSQQMSRLQVREIFRKSELFYCYEDTALAIEAQLCNCPTIFVPNEFFTGIPLALNELGRNGSCTLGEPDGISRAKQSIGNFEDVIRASMQSVPSHISELALKWKALAAAQEYQGTIEYPYEPRLILFDQRRFEDLDFNLPEGFNFVEANSNSNNFVRNSIGLISDTYHESGSLGVVRRILFGIRKHGIRMFISLLSR